MCNYQYLTRELSSLTCSITVEEVIHDKDGKCIFHSEDYEFKVANGIIAHFKEFCEKIIKDAYTQSKTPHFSFAEFILVPHDGSLSIFKNLELDGYVDFRNSKINYFTFSNIIFGEYVNFNGSKFGGPIRFADCEFESLALNEIEYDHLYIENCKFRNQFIFNKSKSNGYTDINNSIFEGFTSINDCEFSAELEHTGLNIEKCEFKSLVDILDNHSEQEVRFTKLIFNKQSRISDFKTYNRFSLTNSEIKDNFQINSSYPKEKLFNNVSEILLDEEKIQGVVILENINYFNLSKPSRDLLESLEKKEKVVFGSGVLKYRVSSEMKTILLTDENQELLLELTEVFSRYFSGENHMNFGIQIYERTPTQITFFYFSNDDISREIFEGLINSTEPRFWNLIKNQQQSVTNSTLPDKILKATDTLIDIASIFLKLTSRLPLGKISEAEINKILQSINVNNQPSINARNVINLTVNNINKSNNQSILLGINNHQEIK